MGEELITEDQPRIKFACDLDADHPTAEPLSSAGDAAHLAALADALALAERHGLTPLLNDGLAAGNCACLLAGRLFVSRSGKRGGERASFVEVVRFERAPWRAVFRRLPPEARDGGGGGEEHQRPGARPSSDTPLLAALLLGVVEPDGSLTPPLAGGGGGGARVVLHGHALAGDEEQGGGAGGGGGGLGAARALGAAISEKATLFSTPEDLAEVEKLLRLHPYSPDGQTLYVRRGHGFFLLGRTVAECRAELEGRVLPALAGAGKAAAAPAPP